MIQGNGFTIEENKFDYFFGRVTSNPHNQNRSLQNLRDLKKLGIDESTNGRKKLMDIFEIGLEFPTEKSKTTNYGTSLIKTVKIEFSNSDDVVKGAIEVTYFYPESNKSEIPKVVNIIPKIYH